MNVRMGDETGRYEAKHKPSWDRFSMICSNLSSTQLEPVREAVRCPRNPKGRFSGSKDKIMKIVVIPTELERTKVSFAELNYNTLITKKV